MKKKPPRSVSTIEGEKIIVLDSENRVSMKPRKECKTPANAETRVNNIIKFIMYNHLD